MLRKMFNGELTPKLALFIIAVLVWTPHTLPFFTNIASGQIFIAIFLAPLAIIGLIFAGFTGAIMVRVAQTKVQPLLVLIGLEVACIIGCIIHEIILVGYPLELCFDFCQNVSLVTAILSYSMVVTVLFIPAYCAVLVYRRRS